MVKNPVVRLVFCFTLLWLGTAQASDPELARQVAAIPDSDLIVYSPEETRYSVTMFTDVNCPFCRRVHTQLDDYMLFDIEIRYAAFPSIDNALEQMHAVWCSEDRKAAMTRAKRGETVEAPACDGSKAVDEQLDLALRLGFIGTPAFVTPAGRVLYGHVSADRLLEELEQEER